MICRSCNSRVRRDAEYCPRCGDDIAPQGSYSRRKKGSTIGFVLTVVVVLVSGLSLAFIANMLMMNADRGVTGLPDIVMPPPLLDDDSQVELNGSSLGEGTQADEPPGRMNPFGADDDEEADSSDSENANMAEESEQQASSLETEPEEIEPPVATGASAEAITDLRQQMVRVLENLNVQPDGISGFFEIYYDENIAYLTFVDHRSTTVYIFRWYASTDRFVPEQVVSMTSFAEMYAVIVHPGQYSFTARITHTYPETISGLRRYTLQGNQLTSQEVSYSAPGVLPAPLGSCSASAIARLADNTLFTYLPYAGS